MPLSPHEMRLYAKNRDRKKTRDASDISPIPDCTNAKLRATCLSSLRKFCEVVFPKKFSIKWSKDHLEAIAIMEDVLRNGGNFAIAMPRGGGKTSLCIAAAIWAILTGLGRFVVLLGANESAVDQLMDDVKRTLDGNEILHNLFPLEVHGFWELEDEPRRCKGQHFEGIKTHVKWSDKLIKFPLVPGSSCSESVIAGRSITASNIRGTHVTLADGQTVIRPDIAIPDDVQTKESAKNPETCKKLDDIIEGDVGRMSGPNTSCTILFPCTVIESGDLAERKLDRKISPHFRGKKFQALYAFPKNLELWDEYWSIRCRCLQEDEPISIATKFYKDHRKEMEAGADVAWPERFYSKDGEISGLQHCMNLWYEKRAVFMAEYQQSPESEDSGEIKNLEEKDVTAKVIKIDRGVVPQWCSKMTSFADVQGKCLYWMVMAWSNDGSGHIVDYGTWPDQRRLYFSLKEVTTTLESYYGLKGQQEAALRKGLDDLEKYLLEREWKREDESVLRIDRHHVDARWGRMTNVVYEYCRRSEHPTIVSPTMGQSFTADDTPMDMYLPKPHEVMGDHWMITVGRTARAIPYVKVDSNYWKSYAAQRLLVPHGSPGCVSIFGGRDGRADHRMLAEHFTAEKATRHKKGNRTVDVWTEKTKGRDNHWFDCYYNNCTAASRSSISIEDTGPSHANLRKRADPPPRRSA